MLVEEHSVITTGILVICFTKETCIEKVWVRWYQLMVVVKQLGQREEIIPPTSFYISIFLRTTLDIAKLSFNFNYILVES